MTPHFFGGIMNSTDAVSILNSFCIQYKLPLEKVASLIGVTRGTLRSWRQGNTLPKGEDLDKLVLFIEILEIHTDKVRKKCINEINDLQDLEEEF